MYIVLMIKHEGKRQLERLSRRWEDIIKMYFRFVEKDSVDHTPTYTTPLVPIQR
jgi:hypothetical protein